MNAHIDAHDYSLPPPPTITGPAFPTIPGEQKLHRHPQQLPDAPGAAPCHHLCDWGPGTQRRCRQQCHCSHRRLLLCLHSPVLQHRGCIWRQDVSPFFPALAVHEQLASICFLSCLAWSTNDLGGVSMMATRLWLSLHSFLPFLPCAIHAPPPTPSPPFIHCRYFSFDYGAVHFVVLDSVSQNRSANGTMGTWLQVRCLVLCAVHKLASPVNACGASCDMAAVTWQL
jgi:hypothetical protein